MKNIVTVLVVLFGLTFAGCESKYRYFCQNPDNWEEKECQKPYCEASGTCPDDLLGKSVASEPAEPVIVEQTVTEVE